MKSQSSLEVPKQVRSASFDEIQLESKFRDERGILRDRFNTARTNSSSSSCSPVRSQDSGGRKITTLKVPQLQSGQRSKSVDVCDKYYLTAERTLVASTSGSTKTEPEVTTPQSPGSTGCYHCACVKEYNLMLARSQEDSSKDDEDDLPLDTEEEADDGDDEETEDISEHTIDEDNDVSEDSRREGSPEIRVTLLTYFDTPTSETDLDENSSTEPSGELFPYDRQRRRSITSPKLARQEALTSFPDRVDDEDDDDDDRDKKVNASSSFVVRDIFLTVPDLRRDRAASVDSCFNNKNANPEDRNYLDVPQQSTRSKSVDIVLPTDIQTRYTALLPEKEMRIWRGWVFLTLFNVKSCTGYSG